MWISGLEIEKGCFYKINHLSHTTIIGILPPNYLLQILYFPGAVKKLGFTEDKVIKKISDMCRMAAHQKGGSKFKAKDNHVSIRTEEYLCI